MSPKLTKGQIVRIRAAGTSDEWCPAYVVLVSGNGESVGLWLEGLVRAGGGLETGCLPLVVNYEKETVTSVVGGHEYEIEVKGE